MSIFVTCGQSTATHGLVSVVGSLASSWCLGTVGMNPVPGSLRGKDHRDGFDWGQTPILSPCLSRQTAIFRASAVIAGGFGPRRLSSSPAKIGLARPRRRGRRARGARGARAARRQHLAREARGKQEPSICGYVPWTPSHQLTWSL